MSKNMLTLIETVRVALDLNRGTNQIRIAIYNLEKEIREMAGDPLITDQTNRVCDHLLQLAQSVNVTKTCSEIREKFENLLKDYAENVLIPYLVQTTP